MKRINIEFLTILYYTTNLDCLLYKTKLGYNRFKKIVIFYLENPLVFYHRFRGAWKYTISFFLAWMVTNGWAYALAFTNLGLISSIANKYIIMLWLPWTPEKLITFPLSYLFHKILWQENGEEAKINTKIQIDLAIIGQ